MNEPKTPCIGICSTTSLGDKICRGCKRFGFEVINWNQYGEAEKRAVLKRLDVLTGQIMNARIRIVSPAKLQQALDDYRFFYDPDMSPHTWLHNLMQKRLHRIEKLEDIGAQLLPAYANYTLRELVQEINEELLRLSEAHFERYFETFRGVAGKGGRP